MNRRDLEHHLQDLFEGWLEGDAFEALEDELRRNPEARAAYREYLHLHHALRFRSQGVDMLRVVPMDRVIERRQRRSWRNAGMAAVAVLILGAVVMALVLTRTPPPTLTFDTSPGTDLSVSHQVAGEKAPQGRSLEPGSRLVVRSGTVELEFASGVRGIVRGPAELALHREDLLHLDNGTAWFEVPATAIGFKVSTPDLILTDLGTEFGILSEVNFLDEVHVFSGKVEVRHRRGMKTTELLQAGQARYAGPAGRWKETPLRRDHFLEALPASKIVPSVIVTREASDRRMAYADGVSATDLLHGLTPVTTGWNLKNDAHPRELTDGIHGADFDDIPGDKVQGAWTTVGATAEYHLGPGANGLGYNLTSIQSIADWNGAGFGNQAWTVEVRPVGGDFRILHTVNYHPLSSQPLDGGGATKVLLTDRSGVLATGIDAIKFTAGHVAGAVDNAFVWREVDVFGKATAR